LPAANINALTYAENGYIYAGDSGSIRTSTDAITWTARTSGTSSSINALNYGTNTFVYAGTGGVIGTASPTYNTAVEFIIPTATIKIDNFNSPLYIKAE
jgi:hypothetical protein